MDLWAALDDDEPTGQADPPACPYCGSGTLSGPVDNGRATRLTCDQCGGTAVATEGGQFMPDLIGQPDNHPSHMPDERSGGVGGAANFGVVHEVQQRTKTSALQSRVNRVYHNDPGCRVCNTPAGMRTAAADKPALPNDWEGGHTWYHGTSYHPLETKDPAGSSRSNPGGTIVAPQHDERRSSFGRGANADEHWNTGLGAHFTTVKTVAHGFAAPDFDDGTPPSRIAHATVHMANPKHYPNEHQMSAHAVDWAKDNGYRYVPRGKDNATHFRAGDFHKVVHKSGESLDYLHDSDATATAEDRKRIVKIDQKGSHAFAGQVTEGRAAQHHENWLATHPDHEEIIHGFRDHLRDQGHDGITYGNRHEGPSEHTCAIAFHDTPVKVHNWQWLHPDSHQVQNEVAQKGKNAMRRIPFEVTASWSDVRNKAQRISAEGGVHIAVSSGDGIGGTVKGDSDLYETFLTYVPGSRKVGYWNCGCKWAAYSWGRSQPFRRFEGRMCSHALAMQFEALKQHAFNRRQVEEHDYRPAWMRDKTVVVQHERAHDLAPAGIDHRRSAALHVEAGIEAADEPADQHPPAYAIALAAALAGYTGHQVTGALTAIGYDTTSALTLTREAFDETFVERSRPVTAGVVDEFKRDILMIGDPEHAEGHGGGGGGGHRPTHSPGVPQDSDGRQHNPLDPNSWTHHTEDSRRDAPEFGKGVPGDDDELAPCDQCGGSGCGHCSGGGQVDLDNLQSRTPDQNPNAGPYSRGQGTGSGGIPTMSSLRELGMRVFADYSSNDWMGDVINRKPNAHSDSRNPGSTGPMTGQDPPAFDNAHPSTSQTTGFDGFTGASKKPQGPTHAGVVLKADDTGRTVMLQRSRSDSKDPAAGRWEWPGGGIEDGDSTSLHAAIREHEEETGRPFPGGTVQHVWRSGPYQGHLVVIPREEDYDPKGPREVDNPDDDNEVVAWRHPDSARKDPELREECKSAPWDKIKGATLDKTALFGRGKEREAWQDTDERNPEHPVSDPSRGKPVPRPTHPEDTVPATCRECGSPDIVAYDNMKSESYCGPHIEEKQSSDTPVRDYKTTGGGFGSRLHPIVGHTHRMGNYYHVAPKEFRDSIQEHGLDHTRGDSAYTGLDFPRGNYLFHNEEHAHHYRDVRDEEEQEEYGPEAREHDVWHVSGDHPVHQDPFHDDESGLGESSVYSTSPIPAHHLRLHSLMHTDPVPALPFTEGEDDDSTSNMGGTPGERVRSQMHGEIGTEQTSATPNSATYASLGSSVDEIVARFQATAGATALATEAGPAGEPGNGDIAAAAAEHLRTTGMKVFRPDEQRALISEGEGGPRARNFGDLRIAGTHYEEIDDEELAL